MPEGPEVRVFLWKLLQYIWNQILKRKTHPLAYLMLFPRVFAEGTRQKNYCSATVEYLPGYTKALEVKSADYAVNSFDASRSKGKPWKDLIAQPLQPGPLHAAARGKCLVIAAGHHAVSINFGLEAHVILMSPDDFWSIIGEDCPGTNKNAAKAKRLRSFRIPEHLIKPGSSPNTKRHINIFAAFVCDNKVAVICDFIRLVRLHIVSSPSIWQESDLKVGATHWSRFWDPFPDGPDWILEHHEANLALDHWRDSMRAREAGYNKSLVDVIGENKTKAFGGFGRHLANDFLYLIAVFPGMPAYALCDDDSLYSKLKAEIPVYMAHWDSEEFIKRCGGTTNSTNPFAFNTTSDRNYCSTYIHVFRKSEVRMPARLFDEYQKLGLFDENHVIGEKYNGPVQLCHSQHKFVPVNYRDKPLDVFTVILAKCPEEWTDGYFQDTFKDLYGAGYATTIGPAQFRESKVNMINTEVAIKKFVKAGRPAKITTGKLGRKRKTPTKASLEKSLKATIKRQGVTRILLPDGEDDGDLSA